MKKNVIFAISMLVAAFAFGQNRNLEEVKVTDFKIINSVSPKIDNEIIRILKNTNGMWLPGYSNGNPVDMVKEVSLAIYFENESTKSVTKIFKEKATNYFNSGTMAFVIDKNPKKAIKHYNRSVNYLPNDMSLLLMRGLCKFELGDKEGALEDWNRMTSLGGFDMSEYIAQIADMKGYNELIAILNK